MTRITLRRGGLAKAPEPVPELDMGSFATFPPVRFTGGAKRLRDYRELLRKEVFTTSRSHGPISLRETANRADDDRGVVSPESEQFWDRVAETLSPILSDAYSPQANCAVWLAARNPGEWRWFMAHHGPDGAHRAYWQAWVRFLYHQIHRQITGREDPSRAIPRDEPRGSPDSYFPGATSADPYAISPYGRALAAAQRVGETTDDLMTWGRAIQQMGGSLSIENETMEALGFGARASERIVTGVFVRLSLAGIERRMTMEEARRDASAYVTEQRRASAGGRLVDLTDLMYPLRGSGIG